MNADQRKSSNLTQKADERITICLASRAGDAPLQPPPELRSGGGYPGQQAILTGQMAPSPENERSEFRGRAGEGKNRPVNLHCCVRCGGDQICVRQRKNQKNDPRKSALRSICVISVPIFIGIDGQPSVAPALKITIGVAGEKALATTLAEATRDVLRISYCVKPKRDTHYAIRSTQYASHFHPYRRVGAHDACSENKSLPHAKAQKAQRKKEAKKTLAFLASANRQTGVYPPET